MIDAFEKHHPKMLVDCEKSLDNAQEALVFLRLNESSFAECENISIDYAIMEKSSNIFCKPLSSKLNLPAFIKLSFSQNWDCKWKILKINSLI